MNAISKCCNALAKYDIDCELPPPYLYSCSICGKPCETKEVAPTFTATLTQPEGWENSVIIQLRKDLAEASENELTVLGLHHDSSVARWIGYQDGLRRAIEIVQRGGE